MDPHMIRSEFLQAFTDDAVGQLRAIAVPTQVPEVKVLKVGGNDLLDDIGRGVVGQMAVAAENALFDAPGAFEVVLKQLEIMVRFENENARGPDPLHDQFGRVAQVRQKSNIGRGRPKKKTDRIVGVVRHAERVHRYVPDLKGGAGRENPAVQIDLEVLFDGLLGETIAEDRNPEFRSESGQTLDVIRVFVSDENAMQTFG